MIDNKIMHRVVNELHKSISVPISICDVGGRVIVSTEPANIGKMNLLALEALNINSKATASKNSPIQRAGAAIPLRFQKSRIGAMVIEETSSSRLHAAELLAKTIELLYQEYILSKNNQNRTQERDQFLYTWLNLQSEYTEPFKKRGEQLGIDVTGARTVILMERNPDNYPFIMPIIKKLLDADDIFLSLSQEQDLIILKENEAFEMKYRRITAAGSGCHAGICSGESHLYTAYQSAFQSLLLGKILFPDEYTHSYEKMKLAITLCKMDIPGIDDIYASLILKGKNAQLAETAITYIQLNGDIQKISDKLHIHRNSIPYRLRRIEEICGRNLMNYYDLLYIFASFIRYTGKSKLDY